MINPMSIFQLPATPTVLMTITAVFTTMEEVVFVATLTFAWLVASQTFGASYC